MNLVSFNIDDKIIDQKSLNKLKRKKNLLYSYGFQNNFSFLERKKILIANIHSQKKGKLKKKNIDIVNESYFKLLEYLTKKLNKVHNKNYSKKFWGILIGKWLYTLVLKINTDWQNVKKINKKYLLKSYTKILINEKNLIPDNTWHSHMLVRGNFKYNLFHHWIITSLIQNILKIKANKIKINNKINLNKKLKIVDKSKLHLDRIFYKSLNNKIFFHHWNVPILMKIKLMWQYKFLQIKLRVKKVFKLKTKNINREKIFENKPGKVNFIQFVKNTFRITFPKVFLEHFDELEKLYLKLDWPKNPKNIFTMYPYYDDLFKFYCAKKNIKKTKIFIFQHGYDNIFRHDNWGINKVFPATYVTYGQSGAGLKKFIFTKKLIFKKKKFKISKKNRILLVLYAFSEINDKGPDGYIDNYLINFKIYKSCKFFLDKASKEILNLVDLKPLTLTKNPILENSIKQNYKNLKLIDMNKSYDDVINRYNISVHFFLGTPFFESMYLNKPAILILDRENQFEFDDRFNVFIKQMVKNKIIFENVGDAIRFLNRNYENLDNWWNSRENQKLINKFCLNFCKRPVNLRQEFLKLIKNY